MRKKRRGRFALLAISLVCVFLAWSVAFLVWLFWSDIERFVKLRGEKTVSEQLREPSQERILEEDRKRLDEILKKRQ
jgi:hypothetical protein